MTMGQLSRLLRNVQGPALAFWCAGCEAAHTLGIGSEGWRWNGDIDRPTFHPSVSVRSGHYASHFKPGDACWCTYYAEHPDEPRHFKCQVCHSFVGGSNGQWPGRIEYLSDCTHALAGQTVDMAPWPVRGEGS